MAIIDIEKHLTNQIKILENEKMFCGRGDWILLTGKQQCYQNARVFLKYEHILILDAHTKDDKKIYYELSKMLKDMINDGKERNIIWLNGFKLAINEIEFKGAKNGTN